MENRPVLELETPFPWPVDVGSGEIGGQEIRGELDAVEVGLDARGQFLDRGGLGQSRCAFDQKVPIGQQRDQEPFDERGLPHDAGSEVFTQLRETGLQRGSIRAVGSLIHAGIHCRRVGTGVPGLDTRAPERFEF